MVRLLVFYTGGLVAWLALLIQVPIMPLSQLIEVMEDDAAGSRNQ
jgi:hypothetical protein